MSSTDVSHTRVRKLMPLSLLVIFVMGIVLSLLNSSSASVPSPLALVSDSTPVATQAAAQIATPATVQAPQAQTAPVATTYGDMPVAAGDTLSGIARQNCWNYKQFREANPQVTDPDKIKTGQKLHKLAPVSPCKPVVVKQVAKKQPDKKATDTTVPSKPADKKTTATPHSPPQAPATAPDREVVWDKVAQCESGNRWNINTGNGFSGGLQFTPSTWKEYGGTQHAPAAYKASKAEQIAIAEQVYIGQGAGAWPVCGKKAHLASLPKLNKKA